MPSRRLERLMWADACEMLDRAERLHRQFYRPGPSATTPNWEPPVDVYQWPEGILLVVALPGVEVESIEVQLADRHLTVHARRRFPDAVPGLTVQRLEIPFGHFERRLILPEGRYTLQQRQWIDGCLHLDLRLA